LDNFQKEFKITINPSLSDDEQYGFLNLCYEFQDIFARSLDDIKLFHYKLPMHLKSPGLTSYTRQYPLKQEEVKAAEKQIQELLRAGLIKETENCEFNSPVFVVKKKSGDYRFVQDLRRINKIIKPLLISLPRIDDLLQDIARLKSRYFSTFDMYRGYWSIQLEEKTSHITSFQSPVSGFAYKNVVAPMGLMSSSNATCVS